jgi:hypothetical protein
MRQHNTGLVLNQLVHLRNVRPDSFVIFLVTIQYVDGRREAGEHHNAGIHLLMRANDSSEDGQPARQ